MSSPESMVGRPEFPERRPDSPDTRLHRSANALVTSADRPHRPATITAPRDQPTSPASPAIAPPEQLTGRFGHAIRTFGHFTLLTEPLTALHRRHTPPAGQLTLLVGPAHFTTGHVTRPLERPTRHAEFMTVPPGQVEATLRDPTRTHGPRSCASRSPSPSRIPRYRRSPRSETSRSRRNLRALSATISDQGCRPSTIHLNRCPLPFAGHCHGHEPNSSVARTGPPRSSRSRPPHERVSRPAPAQRAR